MSSGKLNNWRRREAKRSYAQKIKTETPCADCGIRYPYCVMDFDHVRGEKRYTIGQLCASGLSLDYLAEEISKCDVVCANCHRIRTFARKKWMVATEPPVRIRPNLRKDIKYMPAIGSSKPS